MAQSNSLINAQIHFIDDRLAFIHIPLKCYDTYVQALLQLLNPTKHQEEHSNCYSEHSNGYSDDDAHSEMPWAAQHPFLNISITPIECSVVCSRKLAQEYFAPVISRTPGRSNSNSDRATISQEDFVVISVEGSGLDAGQRVLELTSPLAMAGISIFFITTYFSDYILVPAKTRGQVIRALEEQGFAFEKSAEAYVNISAHHRNASSTSTFDFTNPPSTPPPATVSELQSRTFALLRRRNIVPTVHRDIRLIQCAGRRDSPENNSAEDLALQLGVTKCLARPPRFLSLTLTGSEPPSLLLEKSTLPRFGGHDVLLGSKEDYLIPISLNLAPLPFDATGIVCGVAGKLVGDGSEQLMEPVEMSYLSTARTGTVMVDEKDLERAIEAMNAGEYGLQVH